MNRILVIGAGSIGQRHIKALFSIGEKNVAAYRTNKGNLPLHGSISESILQFHDFDQALSWNPTHVIISNPTALHYQFIQRLCDGRAKLFIEKPVVDDYDRLVSDSFVFNKLQNVKGMVGFNLRYHTLFIELKHIIDNLEYGKALSAYFHVSHYLPFWHPWEDYRTSYVARKEMGGGALSTLTHELDLVQYFFGPYKSVFAKVAKLSDLEIDTDDTTDIFAVNERCTHSLIHLDLLNPILKRFGSIYFEKGVLEYDFIQSKIYFSSYKDKTSKVIFDKKEDYNLQYIRQMENFIHNKNDYGCSIKEGLHINKVEKFCLLSNIEKRELCLD